MSKDNKIIIGETNFISYLKEMLATSARKDGCLPDFAQAIVYVLEDMDKRIKKLEEEKLI